MKFSSSVRASCDGRHAGESVETRAPTSSASVTGKLLLDHDADHADRVAAQAERILVAGRLRADAEHAGERLELVGERDRLRHRRLAEAHRPRSAASNAARSRRRPPRLAVVLRVVAAHQALQLGKLADHVGGQIGLGESRGALGVRPESAPIMPAMRVGELAQAGRRDRAACRACCDRRRAPSFGTRASSRTLRSWSKKNRASASRARSTRSLPSMIARGSAVSRLLTTQEARDELAVAVGEREVFLVLLHRQDQALLRDRRGTRDRTSPA